MGTLFLFCLLAGYIIGLGAVTVIDLHGFLARHSPYWTEATTRTHKVTKPLIWAGIVLACIGWFGLSELGWFEDAGVIMPILYALLIFNGMFLSFVVSPFLLRREKEGRGTELLPANWQVAVAVSFLFSVAGWWGTFLLVIREISERSGMR
jgi:hypothetical protein